MGVINPHLKVKEMVHAPKMTSDRDDLSTEDNLSTKDKRVVLYKVPLDSLGGWDATMSLLCLWGEKLSLCDVRNGLQ